MFSIQVDEELEKQFRRTIGELRGTHKGNLKAALEEAITLWLADAKQKFDKVIKETDDIRKRLERQSEQLNNNMAYLKINDSHRSICDPEFDNLLTTVRTSLEESQKSLKKIDLRYLELKNKL